MKKGPDRDLLRLKEDFLRFSRKAYDMGYVCAAGGNLSALYQKKGVVLIKKTNVSFRDVTKQDIILVGLDGSIVKGSGRPSKEIRAHLAIYKFRPDVRAVIHTHSPVATAFAVAVKKIPLLTIQSQLILKEIPVVKYAPPGSSELSEYVGATFKDPKIKVALLEKHGAIAIGGGLSDAINNAELLEHTARIALYVEQVKVLGHREAYASGL